MGIKYQPQPPAYIDCGHDHDDVSIRMIKICDKLFLKPLILLFENSNKSSCYQICEKDLISNQYIKKWQKIIQKRPPNFFLTHWQNTSNK